MLTLRNRIASFFLEVPSARAAIIRPFVVMIFLLVLWVLAVMFVRTLGEVLVWLICISAGVLPAWFAYRYNGRKPATW